MSENKLPIQLVYGSRSSIDNLNQPGTLAFSRDTQEIIFIQQIGNSIYRRIYSGIVNVSQADILSQTNPNNQFYFANDTGKIYYYISNQGWKSISNNFQRVVNYAQLTQLTLNQFCPNCLYLTEDDSFLYYGVVVGQQIQWKRVNCDGNIGNDSSDSSYSSSTFKTAYFESISFSVNDLPTNGIVTFTYQQLGIIQPTIIQLIDDVGLIRDDIFPVYWDSVGVNINFNVYIQQITSETGNFKLKYLIAQNEEDVGQLCTSLCTRQFIPHNLQQFNYIKRFSFEELNLTEETFVQLIDQDGVVRDDIIPVYWQSDGLYINFSPISSQLTKDTNFVESQHYWKIKYLSTYKINYALQLGKLQKRVNDLTQILNTLLSN